MIKQLSLSNFQSHKKTNLKFSPGVNVIIGSSDTGKTSIIRALRWLIWNRPIGDSFRSTWGGTTEIEIITDDSSIYRWKGGTENGYGLDEQEFNAFGIEVPEEIIQALNLNEINVQNQLDAPFLLSSSPGDVAKHFNKVAHLDQIDQGLKTVQQWIRGIEQDIRSGESQVEQAKEELLKFAHLEKFEIDVEVLEDMQSKFLQEVNNARALNIIIENIDKNQIKIDSKSEILTLEPLLNKILGWIEDRKTKQERAEDLQCIIIELEQTNESIEEHRDIALLEKPVNDLLVMFTERVKLEGVKDSIGKLITNITHTENTLQAGLKEVKKLEKEFEENFPELCPLCGKPYKK